MTKPKKHAQAAEKKIEPTILVAVIALIGTIMAALLSSPLILALVQKTPTNPTTQTLTAIAPQGAQVGPTSEPQCTAFNILLRGGFEYVWRTNQTVRTRLGCPLQTEVNGPAWEQLFERGIIYWLSPYAQIYVMNATTHKWSIYENTHTEGEPLPTLTPPPLLFAPEGGFLKLWLSHPELQREIGWATRKLETMLVGTKWGARQPFNGGVMLYSWAINGHKCRIYVLFDDDKTYTVVNAPDNPEAGCVPNP